MFVPENAPLLNGKTATPCCTGRAVSATRATLPVGVVEPVTEPLTVIAVP